MGVNLFGVDATEEVPTAHLHAAGASFVMRYLSRYSWKVIRSSEYQHYTRNGLHVGFVFEDSAARATAGYDAGKADAEFSLKQARAIVGPSPQQWPPITAAVDYDGNPSDTDAYFDGWAAVLGRFASGPYGKFGVCAHQYARGFRNLWQTYAWSAGQFFDKALVYQYSNDHYVGGINVDFDKAFDLRAFYSHRPHQAPADPLHYHRFPVGPFSWPDGKRHVNLFERRAVKNYDTLSQHPVRNHRQLQVVKHHLALLAERVYWLAHNDPDRVGVKHVHPNLPPLWGKFHRGWRFQQLYKRSRGQRVNVNFKP